MRGRVAVPIHDGEGQLLGYAGRVLADTDKRPGYRLTAGLDASCVLFNLHRLVVGAECVAVVQDIYDAMALHRTGIPAVATSALPDILRMYADERYRKSIVRSIRNETVQRFWRHEFENYHFRMRADAVAPIQNKLGALLSDPTLKRILVEPKIGLSFRSIMNDGQVLLVNLAKGQLGEESSTLLGGLIVSTLGLASFSRAGSEATTCRPFFIYVDEFQTFTTLMLANMMSELRKYGVGLTLAHQHLHQLEPDIRHAVLGNAGTLISFRVGAEDAPFLAKEFQPTFDVQDLLNLPNYNIYLKLMIDGEPSKPFSARTEEIATSTCENSITI